MVHGGETMKFTSALQSKLDKKGSVFVLNTEAPSSLSMRSGDGV